MRAASVNFAIRLVVFAALRHTDCWPTGRKLSGAPGSQWEARSPPLHIRVFRGPRERMEMLNRLT